MSKEKPALGSSSEAGENVPKVIWDDSKMQTTYANVVNAASTREEVSVVFGTNQTWNIRDQKEFTIELSHRIVLNPYAAKRLTILLSRIIAEYEKRFGTLPIDVDPKVTPTDSRE